MRLIPRRLRGAAWTLAIGAASIVALVIAAGALLTVEAIATPIAERILGGPRASVERAWMSYDPWPVGHVRTVEIEGRGHAEHMDARLNVFGVLPRVALVSRLAVTDGALLLELGPSRDSTPPEALGEIVAVDLERVRLDVHRPNREPQVFTIERAQGDLNTGAFELEGSGGGADLAIEGRAQGLSLDGFSGRLTASGGNFADLAAVLGFAAPDTRAFTLSGDLERNGETWLFRAFQGEVGESDLGGDLSVDFAGERPFVRASLESDSLDLADLGVIVGAPADIEDEESNPRQARLNAQYRRSARLIPDTELDLSRVAAVDAEVDFTAQSITAGAVPLEALRAQLALDRSVLRFDPLEFRAPQGVLNVSGRIDAREPDAVSGAMTGRLSDFELAQIGDGAVVRGVLTAQFDVTFESGRTREAFATLDGEATAWSNDARFRALVEEAAGLDLGEAFAISVSESEDDPQFREARCLVAHANIEDGIARLDPAVLDTNDSTTRLNGAINLETEAIELDVASDAKDVSWGSLFGGAQIRGTLRNPDLGAPLGGPIVQAGAAALLGGLTGGLTALPFIEPGLGEDAPCGALLASARAFAEENANQ